MADPHERRAEKIKEAMAILEGHFDGVMIACSYRTRRRSHPPDEGAVSTNRSIMVRGNSHAVEGLTREWLENRVAFRTGYKNEQGRYEAMIDRQKFQAQERREKGE